MIYFTSDTHFGHKNVIEYSKRPFKSVEDMNEGIVGRWNNRVGVNDSVYHLGDVAFLNGTRTKAIVERLNGKIYLCPGNHDNHQIINLDRWEAVSPRIELVLEGKLLVMSHYAHRVWKKSHFGSIMLYGHSHGSMPGNSQSLDVGVDCWDYQPVTFAEIQARLSTLPPYRGEDHHGHGQEEKRKVRVK